MSWKTQHFDKSILKHHKDMLLMADTNCPGMYTIIGFDDEDGFTGATFLASENHDIPSIISGFDTSNTVFYKELTFISSDPADAWVTFKEPGLSDQIPFDYAAFVKRHVPNEAIDLINGQNLLIHMLGRNDAFSRDALDKTRFTVLNFFSTGDTDARRQAVQSFPISAPYLAFSQKITRLIDQRQSFVNELQSLLGLDDKEMKSLAVAERIVSDELNSGSQKLGITKFIQGRDPKQLASDISRLTNTQLPQNAEQLMGYCALCNGIRAATNYSGVSTLPFYKLVRGLKSEALAKGDRHLRFKQSVTNRDDPEGPKKIVDRKYCDQAQMDFINRLSRVLIAAELTRRFRAEVPEALSVAREAAHKIWAKEDISSYENDVLKAFVETIKHVNSTGNKAIVRFLTEDFNLKDLRALETRWHHNQAVLDDQALSIDMDLSWHTLMGQIDMPHGIVAREIDNSSWLNEQGKKENHCVGGYTGTILSASDNSADMIWSIEQAGKILSTVHIQLGIDRDWRDKVIGTNVKIAQQQAKSNTPPSELAKKASAFIVKKIQALPIKEQLAYVDKIKSNRSSLNLDLNRAILTIQANVLNEDLPETVLGLHQRVLPAKLRELNVDELSDKMAEFLGDGAEAAKLRSNKTVQSYSATPYAAVREGVGHLKAKLSRIHETSKTLEPAI